MRVSDETADEFAVETLEAPVEADAAETPDAAATTDVEAGDEVAEAADVADEIADETPDAVAEADADVADEVADDVAEDAADEPVDPAADFKAELRTREGDWFVVHSYSGHEKRVKQAIEHRIESLHMEDYIFQVEVTMEQVTEI